MGMLAAVAAAAVLFGTGPAPEPPSPETTDAIPVPPASYTTTAPSEPFVSRLAGAWYPTWFPGEGTFVGVAVRPDGVVLAVAGPGQGATTSTVWGSSDGSAWTFRQLVEGVVTDLAQVPGGVVAVGYEPTGGTGLGVRPARPTAWVDAGSGFEEVRLPGDGGGVVAAVTTTPTGVVAVGWRGSVSPFAPSGSPEVLGGRPLAWWSPDGLTWTEVDVDADWPAGMYAVAASSAGVVVAGGESGGRAALWESTDGGHTWRLVNQPDTIWPIGHAFTSVASVGETMVAVSGVGGADPPRTSLWRRSRSGWERVRPEGLSEYVSRFLGRVVGVGDEVVGFDLGSYERKGRMWASPDAVEWVDIPVVDPCEGCEPSPVPYPPLQVSVATPDLLGGSASGQPVLWTRTSADIALPRIEGGWVQLGFVPNRHGSVAFWSPELAAVSEPAGVKVFVGGEEVDADWGGIVPAFLTDGRPSADGWLTVGWSEGHGTVVWQSDDGFRWEPLAQAPDQLNLVTRPGADPLVVGIGVEALSPEVQVLDLADQPGRPTYLIGAEAFAGGVIVFGPESTVTVGVDLELPFDLAPTGLAAVGDRLVIAGIATQDGIRLPNTRVFVFDGSGRLLTERSDLPFAPWTVSRVGDVVTASSVFS